MYGGNGHGDDGATVTITSIGVAQNIGNTDVTNVPIDLPVDQASVGRGHSVRLVWTVPPPLLVLVHLEHQCSLRAFGASGIVINCDDGDDGADGPGPQQFLLA
ncbi:hypothetical protein GGX14DRAFT_388347 [Mycena pura]|uniref:Uncharacterized protein n=1 Tax=Mycena pura TaxID=153505 RepID=A0AAD6YLH2_9AGAR|nr:hypothetical protein GGX14DRAFT_388347 [Mycena pura]